MGGVETSSGPEQSGGMTHCPSINLINNVLHISVSNVNKCVECFAITVCIVLQKV